MVTTRVILSEAKDLLFEKQIPRPEPALSEAEGASE